MTLNRILVEMSVLRWLLVLALIGTLPFWVSDLDLRLAAHFYQPGAANPWPAATRPWWQMLYQSVPLLIGLILSGSLAVIIAGMRWPHYQRQRRLALFLITVTLLGPGLLINGVFKAHWGRPRPHQIVAFGGSEAYQPPLAFNPRGSGKSFPSGHSSVGFLIGALFFWWRHERPLLARLSLFISLLAGSLIGMARMAMGDHFASDVIWSAVMVYGVAAASCQFSIASCQPRATN